MWLEIPIGKLSGVMINHASNVLICLQKRNDAVSWVVQSWSVKASVF